MTDLLSDPDFGLESDMTGPELRDFLGSWLFFMLLIARHGDTARINYQKLENAWLQKFARDETDWTRNETKGTRNETELTRFETTLDKMRTKGLIQTRTL